MFLSIQNGILGILRKVYKQYLGEQRIVGGQMGRYHMYGEEDDIC